MINFVFIVKFLILFTLTFCNLHSQKRLFDDKNKVDSALFTSLLKKQIVIVGELHDQDENTNIQTQIIKHLNDEGYRILLECGPAIASALNAYLKDSTESLLYSYLYKLNSNITKSKSKFYNQLINIGFNGEIEYFDVDLMFTFLGFFLIYHSQDFSQVIKPDDLNKIKLYYKSNNQVEKSDYETIIEDVYNNSVILFNKSEVIKEFIRSYEIGLKLQSKNYYYKGEFNKREFLYRENTIKQFILQKYPINDTTTKLLFITGRAHVWLNFREGLKEKFTQYIVSQVGRENVCIIGSLYPANFEENTKLLRYLNISKQEWMFYKQQTESIYIETPNLDIDFLLLLVEK